MNLPRLLSVIRTLAIVCVALAIPLKAGHCALFQHHLCVKDSGTLTADTCCSALSDLPRDSSPELPPIDEMFCCHQPDSTLPESKAISGFPPLTGMLLPLENLEASSLYPSPADFVVLGLVKNEGPPLIHRRMLTRCQPVHAPPVCLL